MNASKIHCPPLDKIKDLSYRKKTHKKKITAFNRRIYLFTRALCDRVEFHVYIKYCAESDAPKTVKYFLICLRYFRLPMTINMSFYVYSVPVLQTYGLIIVINFPVLHLETTASSYGLPFNLNK